MLWLVRNLFYGLGVGTSLLAVVRASATLIGSIVSADRL